MFFAQRLFDKVLTEICTIVKRTVGSLTGHVFTMILTCFDSWKPQFL